MSRTYREKPMYYGDEMNHVKKIDNKHQVAIVTDGESVNLIADNGGIVYDKPKDKKIMKKIKHKQERNIRSNKVFEED